MWWEIAGRGRRDRWAAVRAAPLGYAAVGATRLETPVPEVSETIGAVGGAEAWERAWRRTLTWGIQRRAGYQVQVVDDGVPVATWPRADPGPARVVAGQKVLLGVRLGPVRVAMPVQVVYVVDEPDLKGFAFGTLAGHPLAGEAAFLVRRDADGSVRFLLRSISRPARGGWFAVQPVVMLLRAVLKARYLRALREPTVP